MDDPIIGAYSSPLGDDFENRSTQGNVNGNGRGDLRRTQMKHVESRYPRLPTPMQDIICTAYGVQSVWRRHGTALGTRRSMALAENVHLSALLRDNLVEDRLSQILMRASRLPGYSHAPAYDSGRSAREQLADWPILTKTDLRNGLAEFLTRPIRTGDIETTTSGTTGTPITIWRPRAVMLEVFRSVELIKAWHGINSRVRRASFTGKMAVPLDSSRVWRMNAAGRQLILSQYHLRDTTISAYYKALNMWSPAVLDGYTSNLLDLARLLEQHDLAPSVPLVITTCETLSEGGRELLGRVFGGTVVDQYATSEHAIFAGECPHGQSHLFENIGVIEVVDEHGNPCRSGQVGRLLLTTTLNSLMPLIRYEVGDTGAVDCDFQCPCGRTSPILQSLAGRTDDTVISRDGVPVAIFAFNLIRGMDYILQAQVVQHSLTNFSVKVIIEGSGIERPQFETAISDRFDALLGKDPDRHIRVEYPDVIDRAPGGKVRNVIREF